MRAGEQGVTQGLGRWIAPRNTAKEARKLAEEFMRSPLKTLQAVSPGPSILLEAWRLIDIEEAEFFWEGEETGAQSVTDIVSLHYFALCQSKTGWPQSLLVERVHQAAELFADGDEAGTARRLKAIPAGGRPGFAIGVYLALEATAATRCEAFRALLKAADQELAREAEIDGFLGGLSDDHLRREMERRGYRVELFASNLWQRPA